MVDDLICFHLFSCSAQWSTSILSCMTSHIHHWCLRPTDTHTDDVVFWMHSVITNLHTSLACLNTSGCNFPRGLHRDCVCEGTVSGRSHLTVVGKLSEETWRYFFLFVCSFFLSLIRQASQDVHLGMNVVVMFHKNNRRVEEI